VRAQVARIVGPGDEATTGQIPFTPRAKKVLELSLRESFSLGHAYIGTEHILLALARENEGVAARILLDVGVDAETIRGEVGRVLGGSPTTHPRVTGPGLRVQMRGSRKPPLVRDDDSSVLITGASIATVGLIVGLVLGWLIWG
jgi:ATP-dependent Clp protease ATP-binding subunit ClpA